MAARGVSSAVAVVSTRCGEADQALFGSPADAIGSIKLSALQKIEAARGVGLAKHERQVAAVCGILCEALGLHDDFVGPLKFAAQLHDLGKLGITDALLNKPAPLAEDEIAVMRTHPQIGYDVLSGSGDPLLDFAANIARSHHESFDGSGYPLGLKGEAIPLGARIVSLCDVYDALRVDRIYRAGLGHEGALAVMTGDMGRGSRRAFDPVLLQAFANNAGAIRAAYEQAQPD